MALIIPCGDRFPSIDDDAYVAPNATLIGDVAVGPGASIWFGAVLRGDNAPIRVGRNSNVQDNAVLHADPGGAVEIGVDVTIGHSAVIHGATVGDRSLIGIGAILLNNARIGAESIVGSGAVVPKGREYPPGHLIVGAPARALRRLDSEAIERLHLSAAHYVANARRYRGTP
jgi:carbonic anhydrase/acetyltransferase-like protein (isoleucine patch superfamily)